MPHSRPLPFTCAVCERTFYSETTDEEAVEAGRKQFPDSDDLRVVCEDCYRRGTALLN